MTSASARPIRLAAIDNHPVVLRGIGAVITEADPTITLAALALSVDELFAHDPGHLDVALLDLGIPGARSPEDNVRALVERDVKVLIYTSEERPVPVRRAIRAGADGLLLKIDPVESIIEAIHDVVAGRMACSGPLAHALLTDPDLAAGISERQVEILRAVSDGLPYKSVARRLGISESTVREHLNRAVAAYRARGVDPGNAHGLVSQARRDGHLES